MTSEDLNVKESKRQCESKPDHKGGKDASPSSGRNDREKKQKKQQTKGLSPPVTQLRNKIQNQNDTPQQINQ